MFDNIALNVVTGLVFIFLLYSLLASILQELFATGLCYRAKVLEKAILRMLDNGNTTSNYKITERIANLWHLIGRPNKLKSSPVAAGFYAHPLIKALGEDGLYSKPAYLTSENFSKVMLDLLKGFDPGGSDTQKISDSIMQGRINNLPLDTANDSKNPAVSALISQPVTKAPTTEMNPNTALLLRSFWLECDADTEAFRKKLETWFDNTMDRATGWYKRHARHALFFFGILIAVGFNVDTISIAKKLAHDPALRNQLLQSANSFLERNQQLGEQLKTAPPGSEYYKTLSENSQLLNRTAKGFLDSAQQMVNGDIRNLNELMGLGWDHGFLNFRENKQSPSCIVGWLITALAISLGAPFWFDLLSKLMKLRGGAANSGAAGKPAANNPQAQAPAVAINVNTQSGEEAAVG